MGIPQTRFVKGDWNADCDECGFTFKASQLRRRWDGAMVCKDDYEPRHPQDLLQSRKDKGSVPWTRRPQYQYVTGLGWQLADGTYTAGGDIIADGGVPSQADMIFATLGPIDPDSL